MCNSLARIQEKYDIEVVFDQVKEKFGTLRVYYHIVHGKSWKHKQHFILSFLCKSLLNIRFFKAYSCLSDFIEKKSWYFNGSERIEYVRNGWSDPNKVMNAGQGVEDLVQEVIERACRFSEITCETCGMTGANNNEKGWIRTLCQRCRDKI